MKERPIYLYPWELRALLNGRKSQFRRVAPIADLDIKHHGNDMVTWGVHFTKPFNGVLSSHSGGKFSDIQARSIIASMFSPYGQPGDRLWVREAFGLHDQGFDTQCEATDVIYRADINRPTPKRWRSPIHMPRWASRITLEIVSVHVEHLRDISDEDSLAEGIYPTSTGLYHGSPRAEYRKLWEQINGPGSWDANPWVWAVEFKAVTP